MAVLIRRGKEVLLMKRDKVHGAGTWSTPGGHLEMNETIPDCAAREVMEETGVTIGNPEILGVTEDFFPEHGRHYITIWMCALYVSGSATLRAPEESSEVRWFPFDQLPSPLFSSLEKLLTSPLFRREEIFRPEG